MSQNVDFNKLTIAQLKEQLRAIGGKLGGKKAELVERLQLAYGPGAVPAPVMPAAPLGYAAAQIPGVAPLPVVQAGLPVPGLPFPPAALPIQPAAATKPKGRAKAPPKNPADVLKSAARDADQSLAVALAALMEAYGATEYYQTVVAALHPTLLETKPVALAVPHNAEALKTMKVADLKKILKDRGEKVGGKKEELIARILNPSPAAQPQAQGVLTLPPLAPMAEGLPALPNITFGEDEDEDEDGDGDGDDGETEEEAPPYAALPVVAGLPMVPAIQPLKTTSPALPTVPGLSMATGFPALPTVPGLPMAPALPTVPGALPTLPTIPGVAGSPKL